MVPLVAAGASLDAKNKKGRSLSGAHGFQVLSRVVGAVRCRRGPTSNIAFKSLEIFLLLTLTRYPCENCWDSRGFVLLFHYVSKDGEPEKAERD